MSRITTWNNNRKEEMTRIKKYVSDKKKEEKIKAREKVTRKKISQKKKKKKITEREKNSQQIVVQQVFINDEMKAKGVWERGQVWREDCRCVRESAALWV